jgi:hypothetical protein
MERVRCLAFTWRKSHNQMDYIPTITWNGNKIYLISTLIARNLTRELHMVSKPAQRNTQVKRPNLWFFERLNNLRQWIIQRAGRLILTLHKNSTQRQDYIFYECQ